MKSWGKSADLNRGVLEEVLDSIDSPRDIRHICAKSAVLCKVNVLPQQRSNTLIRKRHIDT